MTEDADIRIEMPYLTKEMVEDAESRGVNLLGEFAKVCSDTLRLRLDKNKIISNIGMNFKESQYKQLKEYGIDIPEYIAHAYIEEIKHNWEKENE